ncbi:hypothetical protein CEXT_438491 [Caerostris extrusa]|uniref:Uncharacterized protein n=1 Tax=Caerostris extrusa TaxID=172846 RepID=A0AAV4U671_CAEEX|nr:hypothetical protein CEXT_438491 [Caerostris extrusa]
MHSNKRYTSRDARKSFNGLSLPTFLTKPGHVLIKNSVRTQKYDSKVLEIEILEANPDYTHVGHFLADAHDSHFMTPMLVISLTHLAPVAESLGIEIEEESNFQDCEVPLRHLNVYCSAQIRNQKNAVSKTIFKFSNCGTTTF